MLKEITSRNQGFLFSSLEDMLAPDSEVRVLDMLISHILSTTKINYLSGKGGSRFGRPAYAFDTMIRIFIYGYMHRLTSSRRLEAECRRNIELMWLTGNQIPDYGTIAGFRANHGDEIKAFSTEFRRLLKKMRILGSTVAVDGTKVKANVNRSNIFTLKQLKSQSTQLESQVKTYLEEIAKGDLQDDTLEKKLNKTQEKLETLKDTIESLESNGQSSYSPVDNDSRLMRSNGGIIPGYNLQAGTDAESGFIVTDIVSSNPSDSHELKAVAEELKSEISPDKTTLLADKGYYCLDDIETIEATGDFECYVGIITSNSRLRNDFIYDSKSDLYICPEGKHLKYLQLRNDRNGNTIKVYKCKECSGCKRKQECSPKSKKGRYIERHKNERFRVLFKKKMQTEKGEEKMIERAKTVERVFGSIKILAGKIPILTHGIKKVSTELKLYCLAYNFRHFLNMFNMRELTELLRNISFLLILLLKKRPILLEKQQNFAQ